jgi:Putative Flp pilus-assembly TadE/G-like
MQVRKYDDRGQAFPIYITAIGGLLFLAFAYFAVGQAAAARSGAQTAADSAALAAAQNTRDQLRVGILDLFSSGTLNDLGGLLSGHLPGTTNSCAKAEEYAALNNADTTDCEPASFAAGYKVDVVTRYTVGSSVVSGTENTKAHATATAVIEPRCRWQSAQSSASPSASPGPSSVPMPGSPSRPHPLPGTLTCDGRSWVIDPTNLSLFPSPADLFSVHLTN